MPEELDAVLEQETRRRIQDAVSRSPGVHVRELAGLLGMPLGTLTYHLRRLEKAGVLSTRDDGRYLRLFPAGEHGVEAQRVLAALRRRRAREILLLAVSKGPVGRSDLARDLGLAESTQSYHLKDLVASGLLRRELEGREARYRAANPELVARLLAEHRESFADRLVDRVLEVWMPPEGAPGSFRGPGRSRAGTSGPRGGG